MADDRNPRQIQEDRDRLLTSVDDAVAVANSLGQPNASFVLPALISGVVTSKSIGGLMRKLFGVSNRDLPYIVQPQTYPCVTTATAGARDQFPSQISQDSDFYAMRLSIISGNDGSGTFDSLLNLKWGANDRFWVQGLGTHVLALNGNGRDPYVFPQPIYLARNSTLFSIFTALTANARTYFIDFHGRKTVDVSSLDLTTRRW